MALRHTTAARWGQVGIAALLVASVTAGTPGTAFGNGAIEQDRAGLLPAVAKADKVVGSGDGMYIVQLAAPPAVAYDGGVSGFPATRPARGSKIDAAEAKVARYVQRLTARHDAVLSSAKRNGSASKAYSYGISFDGFAATLTEAEAQRVAQQSDVVSVTKDVAYELETATTPAFLGLTGDNGFYKTFGATGEDVVIGVVDSGVWPQHPSFSDRDANGKRAYRNLPGWRGKCVVGEQFTGTDCNQKLIGARYYNAGFGGNAGIDRDLPFEFNSPRDHNGHGSHTASTAGGNANVPATGQAAAFGAINGIAPRARIAAYKTCWSVPGTAGSCFGSDSIAAIDQAVADGVDVLNYSVSGSRTSFRDPVEIAFLFAADAGVFVATSAGNSGPTASTVAHPGPWLTTVAAGTHNRDATGSVTLGNGQTYTGASLATPVGPAPFIDSTTAGLAGANAAQVALCYSAADTTDGKPVLDPAKVKGKIILCDRGVIGRTSKSQAVKDAGGIGMVLVNTGAGSINADLHAVPTVHLAVTDRAAVKAYAATAGATASIAKGVLNGNAPAPFTASFSSRGPLAASGSLLKPDLIAPGQDILAAVAPPNNNGKLFDLYSGTSMSSPHVAGLGALLTQLHPTWSPMAIKSALMTTGGDVLDGPSTSAGIIFRQGAGHVRPSSAADPGLVFDAGFDDWIGFLCGTQLPVSFCAANGIEVVEPSNYNGASVAFGALAGNQSATRTVTNVGTKTETYSVAFSGLAGFTSTASPQTVTVAPGQSADVVFTLTRTTAPLNTYTGGQITMTGDQGHRVRLPVVARPVALAAPTQVSGSYGVVFGYTGPFSATPRGLVPAARNTGAVATNETARFDITVPAGTTYARFSLFDKDVSQASDLDLEIYEGTRLIGASGSGTSDEEVSFAFASPTTAARTFRAEVFGFAVPTGQAQFTLSSWAVGTASLGNLTVKAPASAVPGPGRIELATSGLLPATRYLGTVAYAGEAGLPAPTVVRIDTP